MNVFEENGITHLDLHGVRHFDVSDEVIDFIFQYQIKIPLIIICGNSNKMLDIVKSSLTAKSIMFSMPRFGIIRVEKL
ncbi:MAG: hypothetical protein VXZ97_00290 [Pseudomonadota bacterium]|nr:hypothetical protein [Pseudomonadota bacterium]|tara:strand:+ start:717 stop:950 length:234 start_codon:yes stop_codon:yes gene_type:complete